MIQFTRITPNKPDLITKDNEDIIMDCFQFCTPAIKRRVKKFLETDWHRQVTIVIKNEKVVLKKL